MSILTSLEDQVAVDGLDLDEYRQHPALSYSGAKLLLPPSCPALFKHYMENGRANKPAFDFGHAAHRVVLGAGETIDVHDFDEWRTNAAKAARRESYAAGHVPLLAKEWDTVSAMAEAIKEHPVAGALFSAGEPERALFWHDRPTGVELKARLDWITALTDGRPIGVDFKSCVSVEPDSLSRTVANFSYHMQAAFYTDALAANGYDDPGFLFVCQEKTAPFLVTVIELDSEAMRAGRARARQAIDLYADCVANDTWPSYADGIELIRLPRWAS